ncbi:MAG: bifunctional serine/threonine-protein kinase/formylglycine-generating enzyme family protein, partial [Nannocystaceae bacterium]
MESKQEIERLVGTVLDGKYRIEAVVGRGGFGVVYRARHLIWDQPVAIKVLTKLTNTREDRREEVLNFFIREGRLLSELSSRTTGIVQARDVGTITSSVDLWMPYMVLEWLDGRHLGRVLTLERRAGGRARDLREVFQIFDGVARALAIAHSAGVAHRDIKPPNIFVLGDALAPGAVLKLLDFGIAKVMQTESEEALHLTGDQEVMFTPQYGAPEQFNRKLGASGPWTDVFAMALVLVEVLTGRRPFAGTNFSELLLECLDPSRRPTPRAFGVELGDEAEAVFARALALRPEQRFRSMGDFWMRLVAALKIDAYPPLAVERTGDAAVAANVSLSDNPASSRILNVVGDGLGSLRALNSKGDEAKTTIHLAPKLPTVAAAPAPAGGGRPRLVLGVGLLLSLGVAAGSWALQGAAREEAVAAPAGPQLPAPAVDEAAAAPPPGPCPKDMVFVPGGKYFMGTDVADVPALSLARPAHKVEVAAFCLDRTEVTVAAYRACAAIGECKRAFPDAWWPQGSTAADAWARQRELYSPLCNGDAPERGEHPVNCVTWAQADEYCRYVDKRLPREPEWEFAARGSDGRVFPWGDHTPSAEYVNGCGSECVTWRAQVELPATAALYDGDDGYVGTAPVGSFPMGATQLGAVDMIGNV